MPLPPMANRGRAMNMRAVLTVNAILAVLHGIGFILAPSLLLSLYQVPPSPGASLMGQLFGAQLLVVAIICWKGRDFSSTSALSALVVAGLVPNVAGAIIGVMGILGGAMGTMGWLGVMIYAGLALAYLAVQLRKGYQASAA